MALERAAHTIGAWRAGFCRDGPGSVTSEHRGGSQKTGYGNVPLFKHHAFTLARAPLFCGSALELTCRCPKPRVSAPETRPVVRGTRVIRAVVLAVDVDGGLLTTPPPLVSPAGVAVDAQ